MNPTDMNAFDRMVAWVDPVAGMRRIAARQAMRVLNTGYSEGGAAQGKPWTKGWRHRGGSTVEDIEANLGTLQQRSRDLMMNGPIGRAAMSRYQTNVVGSGLKLRATPEAETLGMSRDEATAWARSTEREFALWAESKDCDQTGLNDFYELQQVALLSQLASGDVFALLPMGAPETQPYQLRIQLIEADRVCNPGSSPSTGSGCYGLQDLKMRQGVEIDANGRVVAYHICNTHPLAQNGWMLNQVQQDGGVQGWKRISRIGAASGRLNVIHMIVCERPEQYRGVPLLAPVIEELKKISSYSKYELAAAAAAALFTVFVKSLTPQTPFSPDSRPDIIPRDENDYALGSGAVVFGQEGEDVSVINPMRPNVNFAGFVDSVAQQIGAAINVPVELLLLQFKSTYSASRAALLEAWKAFRMWRTWMAADFCQPIYSEWLWEAVLTGRVVAPGFVDDPIRRAAWASAQWHGPSPGQIDPMVEVQAAKERIDARLSTRSKEALEISAMDFDVIVAEQAIEKETLQAAGLGEPGGNFQL